MDLEILRLSTKSLRTLVQKAPRRRRERRPPPMFQGTGNRQATEEVIRKLSLRMVEAARAGRRKVKLFELSGYFGGNPERLMSPHQKDVFRHFDARARRLP